jgi:tRNA(Ile)-lysidine synthase
VCLLHALWSLRRLLGIRLEVFHFDHRLRGGSARDADYVRRLAERLRLPFHLRAASDRPARGASVEAWATAARGEAAGAVREAIGAAVVAEGHTLDDQAGTVLMNLIRGGGLEAIAGIWPGGRDSAIVQPLIEVEREEVEAFCRALHLRPRRDPTNRDPRLLRNAIRMKVVPAIERATGRAVRRPIARSAALLREDRAELYAAADDAMPGIVTEAEGRLRFDARALSSLPKPVASRVVRLALQRLSGDDAAWTRGTVGAILDLAVGHPGRRRDLGAGLKASRDRVYVWCSRTSPESRV